MDVQGGLQRHQEPGLAAPFLHVEHAFHSPFLHQDLTDQIVEVDPKYGDPQIVLELVA